MKIAIAIVVAVLVIGGAYLVYQKVNQPVETPVLTAEQTPTPATATVDQTTTTQAQAVPATSANTVTYNGSTFTPAKVTIKNGEAIQFINNSSGPMWVASDPHPTHQGYSGTTASEHCPDTTGTAFDECTAVPQGGIYTFTFKKAGTWGYHNHANHSATGSIVVTP